MLAGPFARTLKSAQFVPVAIPRGLLPAVAIAALWVAANLAYTAWWSPHDLAPDEAHYWDWSRHLDWCYYSKGPLVAWLIAGSTALFGQSAFAVRLPAACCGGLIALGLWAIAKVTFRDDRFARRVLLLSFTLPPLHAASMLTTIDPPFLACWAWAMVALLKQRWLAVGTLVAIGSLAKPTMCLFPPCVVLLMAARPNWRDARALRAIPIALVGLAPQFLWNAANGWVNFKHLAGLAAPREVSWSWFGPLAFLGGQFALLIGVWFVAWIVGAVKSLASKDESKVALGWLSLPLFAFFLLASVRGANEINWPAPAYLGGFVLAVRAVPPSKQKLVFGFAIAIGLSVSFAGRVPQCFRPGLAALLPAPTPEKPDPIRKLDPTARLGGWKHLAERVDYWRHVERDRSGRDPHVAGMIWTLPGELGFYCQGQPTVYSFGPALADRMSQYDLWRPNPVADAQAFAGETFVYVGGGLPPDVFDEFELVESATSMDGTVPLAHWTIWIGRGYRGWGQAPRTAAPRY